jgi:hypothetical protein
MEQPLRSHGIALLTLARGLLSALVGGSGSALASHPRPGSGSPLRVALVPAFAECQAPNEVHAPPLDYQSWTPPGLESSFVTTSKIGRGAGVFIARVFSCPRCESAINESVFLWPTPRARLSLDRSWR